MNTTDVYCIIQNNGSSLCGFRFLDFVNETPNAKARLKSLDPHCLHVIEWEPERIEKAEIAITLSQEMKATIERLFGPHGRWQNDLKGSEPVKG